LGVVVVGDMDDKEMGGNLEGNKVSGVE